MDHRKRQQSPQQQRSQQEIVGQASFWNYPIPPPEILNQFPVEIQRVFITEFQAEAAHRRAIENEQMAHQARDLANRSTDMKAAHTFKFTSLFAAVFLIVFLVSLAAFFVYLGKSIEALLTVIGIVMVIWTARPKNK